MNNQLRNGNFTSSENVALVSVDTSGKRPGKPFWTYIEETNMERRLGRSLTDELTARAVLWGKLLERRAFELLGTDYKLCSQETIPHPDIDCWAGSPDADRFNNEDPSQNAVIDFKCPITLKSFCQLVQPFYDGLRGMDYFNAIRSGYTDNNGNKHEKHKDGEKFYWQLVSNACITNRNFIELIVYLPYQSELSAIRELCEGNKDYYSIYFANEDELPFLIDGGYYKNINVMRAEIPQADKDLLTERVLLGREYLIPVETLVNA